SCRGDFLIFRSHGFTPSQLKRQMCLFWVFFAGTEGIWSGVYARVFYQVKRFSPRARVGRLGQGSRRARPPEPTNRPDPPFRPLSGATSLSNMIAISTQKT